MKVCSLCNRVSETVVSKLVTGAKKSLVCAACSEKKDTLAAIPSFNNAKAVAGDRWHLSEKDYAILAKHECLFCKRAKTRYTFGAIGLDRRDRRKGFTVENTFSCCSFCKQVRSKSFTYNEMVRWIGPLIDWIFDRRLKVLETKQRCQNRKSLLRT